MGDSNSGHGGTPRSNFCCSAPYRRYKRRASRHCPANSVSCCVAVPMGLTLDDPVGDLAHKSRGNGSTAFLILNCYHGGFGCERPVAVLELHAVLEFQGERGSEQRLLRRP